MCSDDLRSFADLPVCLRLHVLSFLSVDLVPAELHAVNREAIAATAARAAMEIWDIIPSFPAESLGRRGMMLSIAETVAIAHSTGRVPPLTSCVRAAVVEAIVGRVREAGSFFGPSDVDASLEDISKTLRCSIVSTLSARKAKQAEHDQLVEVVEAMEMAIAAILRNMKEFEKKICTTEVSLESVKDDVSRRREAAARDSSLSKLAALEADERELDIEELAMELDDLKWERGVLAENLAISEEDKKEAEADLRDVAVELQALSCRSQRQEEVAREFARACRSMAWRPGQGRHCSDRRLVLVGSLPSQQDLELARLLVWERSWQACVTLAPRSTVCEYAVGSLHCQGQTTSALPRGVEGLNDKWDFVNISSGLSPATYRVGVDPLPDNEHGNLWFLKRAGQEAGKGVRVISSFKDVPVSGKRFVLQEQPPDLVLDAQERKRVVRYYLLLLAEIGGRCEVLMHRTARVTAGVKAWNASDLDPTVQIQNDYHCVGASGSALLRSFYEKHGETRDAAGEHDADALHQASLPVLEELASRIVRDVHSELKQRHFCFLGVDVVHSHAPTATTTTTTTTTTLGYQAHVLEMNHYPGINPLWNLADRLMLLDVVDCVWGPSSSPPALDGRSSPWTLLASREPQTS